MRKPSLLLLLPMLLASCGQAEGEKASFLIKDPVTISLWSLTDEKYQPTLNRFISEFKEIEPNVTILSKILNGSYNNLSDGVLTGFGLNNYPDLAQCYPDHVVNYLGADKVIELGRFYGDSVYGLSEEDKSDYIQSFFDEGRNYTKAGLYSLPWNKSTEVMFYNEDKLLGLNLSAYDPSINGGQPLTAEYFASITWEELLDKLCPAIDAYNTATNQSLYTLDGHGMGGILAYDSDENLFITAMVQYGAGYTSIDASTGIGSVDFNNPNAKALLKKFHTAHKNHYLITKESYGDYTSSLFTDGHALFAVSSNTGASYNFDSSKPMNVGVTRIPHAEGRNPMAINQGPSLCLLSHQADDPDNAERRAQASWLFYKHLTSKDNSLTWSLETDYLPVRQCVYASDAFQEASTLDGKEPKTYARLKAKTIQMCSAIGEELFSTPTFKGSSTARSQAKELIRWALTTSDYDGEVDERFQEAEDTVIRAMED